MMLSHLPWEQALGLDGIDPLSSPAVKDRWLALTLTLNQILILALALTLALAVTLIPNQVDQDERRRARQRPEPAVVAGQLRVRGVVARADAAQGVHLQLEEQPARQGLEGAARLRDGPGVRAA